MKLKNQVVSLELAKKLKELNFPQESLWYWVLVYGQVYGQWELTSDNLLTWLRTNESKPIKYYSAYTVAELLEDMPSHIKKGDWGLTIQKTPDVGYMVSYQNGFGECWKGWDFCYLSLANSLARMKIRLKKEKLL